MIRVLFLIIMFFIIIFLYCALKVSSECQKQEIYEDEIRSLDD